MRKVVMFNFVSMDGYFAGVDGDITWHPVDKEFDSFAGEFITQFDAALFGRITYDLFADYWPTAVDDPNTSPEDRAIAKALNDMTKIVVSSTEPKTGWQGTEWWPDITAQKVTELKQQDGKNIVIYGSGTIVKQLTDIGVIDEYHVIVGPLVLGAGKLLFEGVQPRQLELMNTKTFASGNVLLSYRSKVVAPE